MCRCAVRCPPIREHADLFAHLGCAHIERPGKKQSMSLFGQKRRFDDRPVTCGLPLINRHSSWREAHELDATAAELWPRWQ